MKKCLQKRDRLLATKRATAYRRQQRRQKLYSIGVRVLKADMRDLPHRWRTDRPQTLQRLLRRADQFHLPEHLKVALGLISPHIWSGPILILPFRRPSLFEELSGIRIDPFLRLRTIP